MEQIKQALAPLKDNRTRVIIQGNKPKERFCVEFDNEYLPKFFKKNGIRIPEAFLSKKELSNEANGYDNLGNPIKYGIS